jgi:hypothetical protein
MGIINSPYLDQDAPISQLLSELYEISGHQLALQYGGMQSEQKFTPIKEEE